jgi:hypothetical protein
VLALTVEQGSYVHVTPVSFRRSSKPARPPRGSSALNWYTLPRWTQLPLSACLLVALGLGLEQAATPDWSHLASPCSCHVRATDSAGCSRVCVDGPGPTPKCWSDVRNWRVKIFSFFTFFFPFLLQKYMIRKKLHNYASSAVRDGGRDLPPFPERLPTGRGPLSFQKFVIFLFELGWR